MRTIAWLTAVVLLAGCSRKSATDEAIEASKEHKKDAGAGLPGATPGATLLVAGQNVPMDLHVDDSHLCWVNEGRRAEGVAGLFCLPKGGTEPKLIAPGKGIYGIAIDADQVYWTVPEAFSVFKAPKGGGEPTTVAADQESLSTLALDVGSVYWTGKEDVWAIEKAGGKPRSVASKLSTPGGLQVDDGFTYFYSVIAGKLARAPKKGGPAKVVVAEDRATLHAFLVDEAALYWSFGSQAKMEINRMPKGGGKVVQVVTGQDPPVDIEQDATHLYWTTGDAILKVAKSGGGASTVVEKVDRALSLAVDGSFVYWTDRVGRVQKAPK
ncbi:MAG: hypothetical protein ACYC8T_12395 [Myxococcaceae bacterium]